MDARRIADIVQHAQDLSDNTSNSTTRTFLSLFESQQETYNRNLTNTLDELRTQIVTNNQQVGSLLEEVHEISVGVRNLSSEVHCTSELVHSTWTVPRGVLNWISKLIWLELLIPINTAYSPMQIMNTVKTRLREDATAPFINLEAYVHRNPLVVDRVDNTIEAFVHKLMNKLFKLAKRSLEKEKFLKVEAFVNELLRMVNLPNNNSFDNTEKRLLIMGACWVP
ncbi:hypothetical protein VKT23_010656 [Stygiomarasmius scandens]|uniref:Uncharacterized protein n=1 Tax=Marasmiellus scandens TaxID=2682957 RepID=A0ABR1JGP0_9AGAR